MNLLAIVGAFIITLSLLAYGIGTISIIRFKIVGSVALIFLTLGVIFDVTAVIFMILGAQGTPFSWHGIFGYSAFLVMLIDTFLVWRQYFLHGIDTRINKRLEVYSKYAYIWWVIAYITGSLIILWR